LLANLIILLKLDYYGRTMIREFKYFIKFDYYDVTIVGNLIILLKLDHHHHILLLTNLIILLNLDYCGRTMICEFKYFIKVRFFCR
jgi:hypothetical protein